jgi:hypothetical protein
MVAHPVSTLWVCTVSELGLYVQGPPWQALCGGERDETAPKNTEVTHRKLLIQRAGMQGWGWGW